MADTDDWGGVAVDNQSNPDDWGGVPVTAPKPPNIVPIQKMAQDNLAANDNKDGDTGTNPQERLNTAVGQPLHQLMNPDDTAPINPALRKSYTQALQNGSASNFGDFMQTALHTVAPIAAGMINPVENLKTGPATKVLQAGLEGVGQGYEEGKLFPEPIDSAVEYGAGKVANAPFQTMASLFSGFQSAAIKTGEITGFPKVGKELALLPEEMMGLEGIQMHLPPEVPSRALGPWDNHPGSEPIKQLIAKRANTYSATVSSSAVDQHIAQGASHKAATGEDFKSVATVTGIPETALHNVYAETGIAPDQVFVDAQHNPDIATDVAAGKVPSQYEHLVTEKPVLPEAKTEALSVARDEATRSFNVVDKDGDHVSGGFDSAEEARHYIEDEKFRSEERAAIENEGAAKLQDVLTPESQRALEQPKPKENIYAGVEDKIDSMTQGERDLRLETLNKKMEAGIITPKELGEREALSAKKQEPAGASPFNHRPTEREIPTDNYSKNLSEYSPVMYRETSANGALELLPHGGVATDVGELHLADITDMATGQGKNKGVMIAFDTDGLKGQRNRSKPTADMSYSQGFGEYYGKHNKQFDYQKSVSAVRISKDAVMSKTDKAMLSRTLKTLEEKGWTKTEADKYTEYTKPKSATELDVAGKQGEQLAAANEGRLKPTASQKAPSEGLFDVAGRGQSGLFSQKSNIIPPSESGRVTSLKQFLRNNGAKFDENGNLVSMKGKDLDHATELAQQHGYTNERLSVLELQNLVKETPNTSRAQDIDRVLQAEENAKQKQWKDPAFIENQAHKVGIDTTPIKDETQKQHTNRLLKALQEFYKSEEGSGSPEALRQIIGGTIQAVEKFTGKLTGGFFDKLADGYIKTFQPELMGDKALRADAYLAKYKAKLQEAQNSYYKASELEILRWEKAGLDAQKEWLYDHETGRWNETDNPDHARTEAMYDALHEQEKNAGVGTDAYKDNYLPHQYEKPEAVEEYFRSEAMIKKYGKDWFNKASVFKLVQEADRAGFKLKTYNPERMMIARQQASYNMIATMDLLRDFESSGMAKKATAFTIDKKIGKTEQAIADIQERYKKEFADIEKQKSLVDENGKPIGEPVSAQMIGVQDRIADLNKRLEDFKQEKAENKLTPEQMKELKTGFRVIGPDSKAWIIHQQVGPLWKNAMDMKGLYENQGLAGDAYRNYMAGKAVYVRTKMLASLFHPTHEVVIDISSDLASAAHHLVQGGKISDLLDKKILPNIGLGKYTAKLQDNPQMTAWNTPHEMRTTEQQSYVTRMVEGGFAPTVPRENVVNFKENFNKAIDGIGKNNLRLLGTALEIPSLPMAPLMEHWIPGMKTESYFQRTDLALARDPSLATDAGRRSETFRKIAQDIERNYGEMNRNTQFWNPVVRDIFNATTFSGGWKLAMLQNFRGLAEPGKIAYNWAKTGEFSKGQVTHQMLQSYIYTANMLMLGAGLNYLFTGAVGTIKDWISPQTGDKNADGTPIRLRQPAFFNEPIQLMHDINSDGVVPGTGSFFYHQTLIPGIANSLLGRDFVGRPYITDPTDLHQWKNMGLESISPIALSNKEKSEQRGSSTAEAMGWIGFPMAGAYINQTPFEQKVIGTYYHMHPSEGGEYQAKLKAEMRGAVAAKDTKEEANIEAEMKYEHMKSSEISNAKKQYTTPFSEFAWGKLSIEDQKRLIESASEKEKKNFKVKSE